MEEKKFPRWVELPEFDCLEFGDLPGLIAQALHSGGFAQAAAELAIQADLRAMVDAGTLQVLDPLTLGPHAFPIGEALRRSLVRPSDIRPILEARNIGLRLLPIPEFREEARPRRIDPELLTLDPKMHVRFFTLPRLETAEGRRPVAVVITGIEEQMARQASGFYSLAEAAHIVANANPGCEVKNLIRRMIVARVKGRRLPRENGSKLPVPDEVPSRFYGEWVATTEDIDAWLEDEGAPYRFPKVREAEPPQAIAQPDPQRRLQALRALGGSATRFKNEWTFKGIKALVKAEADAGRKRASEKTIRADLTIAAEAEFKEGKAKGADRQWPSV